MSQVSNCSDDLYKLMMDCWRDTPEQRPDFKDVLERLIDVASDKKKKEVIDLKKSTEEEIQSSDDYGISLNASQNVYKQEYSDDLLSEL